MLECVIAGLGAHPVPYDEGLERQRAIHARVVAGEAPDTLLLVEHPSVYTAGKRTDPSEYPADGTPVVHVDRGGKITWHGPGQLVGYPIIRLPDPIDVVAYVRALEGVLISVVAQCGVDSGRIDGRSGVWVHRAHVAEKIAAIGIRVSQGVTMHGFALNCNNAFDRYENIVACGLRDAGVTSLTREVGHTVTTRDVASLVCAEFNSFSEVAA